MRNFIDKISVGVHSIRQAPEHIKTVWIYSISVAFMLVIGGFWLVYIDYRLPAIAPPTGNIALAQAVTPQVGVFGILGRGFSYITHGVADRVTRGLGLVTDQFSRKNTFTIEGKPITFTPATLPPLERGVLPR